MPESYSINDVAKIMKITPYTVRKLAREQNKKIWFKAGREWRLMEDDLKKWIEELREKSYNGSVN